MYNGGKVFKRRNTSILTTFAFGEQQEPKGKIPVDNIKLKRERTGRDGDTDLGIIYVKKILEIMKFDSLTTESS